MIARCCPELPCERAMTRTSCSLLIAFGLLILAINTSAQADDVCREFGETPTREMGRDNRLLPFVYGRIVLKGVSQNAKPPRVTAIYSDSAQPATRQLIAKSGNYCFKKLGSGGTLIIDIDGVETARKSVSDIGGIRQREDFEIYPYQVQQTGPPGVISTKFVRPQNEKTIDLYRKTAEAERSQRADEAIKHVKEIVLIDPDDFIAWAKLGSMYIERNALVEAEAAFNRSLALRADYSAALVNLGIISAVQKHYPQAIERFKHAIKTDPTSARVYRLLGEAYLHNRQGTLGLATLDEALRLDPIGMAECHLLKARLYDLAGAKPLAAAEYKTFLKKVQDHPDRKNFEKYIKDNSE